MNFQYHNQRDSSWRQLLNRSWSWILWSIHQVESWDMSLQLQNHLVDPIPKGEGIIVSIVDLLDILDNLPPQSMILRKDIRKLGWLDKWALKLWDILEVMLSHTIPEDRPLAMLRGLVESSRELWWTLTDLERTRFTTKNILKLLNF